MIEVRKGTSKTNQYNSHGKEPEEGKLDQDV